MKKTRWLLALLLSITLLPAAASVTPKQTQETHPWPELKLMQARANTYDQHLKPKVLAVAAYRSAVATQGVAPLQRQLNQLNRGTVAYHNANLKLKAAQRVLRQADARVARISSVAHEQDHLLGLLYQMGTRYEAQYESYMVQYLLCLANSCGGEVLELNRREHLMNITRGKLQTAMTRLTVLMSANPTKEIYVPIYHPLS